MVRQMKNTTTWGWTDERRAKQAAAIYRWQPWRNSTGPRTVDGKASSACNASRPNSIRKQLLMIKRELAQIRRMVKAINAQRQSPPPRR
jgi:hypothetical protein